MSEFTPERILSDELLTCWLLHGPDSDEFMSLVAMAAHEFDAETVISTLTCVCAVLIRVAADHLGVPESHLQSTLTTPFTNPKETHDA